MKLLISRLDHNTCFDTLFQWTDFLVNNYYKLSLNRDSTVFSTVRYYGKRDIKFSSSTIIPKDLDIINEEMTLIDTPSYHSIAVDVIWPMFLRLFYRYNEDELMYDPEQTFDMDKFASEMMNLLDGPGMMSGIEAEQVTRTIFLRMAGLARFCLFTCTQQPSMYILRGSLEIYIYVMTMLHPTFLFPNFTVSQHRLNVSYEKPDELNRMLKTYLETWSPDTFETILVMRVLMTLSSFPGTRNVFIYKKIYENPKQYYVEQFNLHLYKPLRTRDSMREFNLKVLDTIEMFNINDSNAFDRFFSDTNITEHFKLVLMHKVITSQMFYEGFIHWFVIGPEQLLTDDMNIRQLSDRIPFIYRMSSMQYGVVYKNELYWGSVEECICMWLQYTQGTGIPLIKQFEKLPSVYYWFKVLPSFVKEDLLVKNESTKDRHITFNSNRNRDETPSHKRTRVVENDDDNLDIPSNIIPTNNPNTTTTPVTLSSRPIIEPALLNRNTATNLNSNTHTQPPQVVLSDAMKAALKRKR